MAGWDDEGDVTLYDGSVPAGAGAAAPGGGGAEPPIPPGDTPYAYVDLSLGGQWVLLPSLVAEAGTYKVSITDEAQTDVMGDVVRWIASSVPVVATPVIEPDLDDITAQTPITITCATSSVLLWFTLNGSDPKTSLNRFFYDGSPFYLLPGDYTVRCFAERVDYINSFVAAQAYTVAAPAAEIPVILPAMQNITDADLITLSTASVGALIYYTINDSIPGPGKTLYQNPFTLSIGTVKVRAMATGGGYADSAESFADYIVTDATPQVATPSVVPNGGTITTETPITITTSTPNPIIYYTTDGNDPDPGLTYTGPFTLIEGSYTLKIIATKAGYDDSALVTVPFTVNTPAQSPAALDAETRSARIAAYGNPVLDVRGADIIDNPAWSKFNGLTATGAVGISGDNNGAKLEDTSATFRSVIRNNTIPINPDKEYLLYIAVKKADPGYVPNISVDEIDGSIVDFEIRLDPEGGGMETQTGASGITEIEQNEALDWRDFMFKFQTESGITDPTMRFKFQPAEAITINDGSDDTLLGSHIVDRIQLFELALAAEPPVEPPPDTGCPDAGGATQYYLSDWETGAIQPQDDPVDGWNQQTVGEAWSANVVSGAQDAPNGPADGRYAAGQYFCRLECRPGDSPLQGDIDEGRERSQLLGKMTTFSPNEEIWVGFSFFIPSALFTDNFSDPIKIFQFHGSQPYLKVGLKDGLFHFNGRRGARISTTYCADFSTTPYLDRWVDVVLHTKFNPKSNPGAGYLQAWFDETIVCDYSGDMGFDDKTAHFMLDIYGKFNTIHINYFDAVRVAKGPNGYNTVHPLCHSS